MPGAGGVPAASVHNGVATFSTQVATLCIQHILHSCTLAEAALFRFPEIACWMYTGERQVIALRKAYLDAVLRQDVGFFDTDARTGDIVFGVSTDTLLVQDAIGEKVGNFIHYIATFLAGLVVGFVAAWRLALLSVAVIPAIAFAGGLYAYTLTGLTSKSRESYANAGVVAEQVTDSLASLPPVVFPVWNLAAAILCTVA